jgi:hypothetical protein
MLQFKYLHLGGNSFGNYKGININGTIFIYVHFELVAFVSCFEEVKQQSIVI